MSTPTACVMPARCAKCNKCNAEEVPGHMIGNHIPTWASNAFLAGWAEQKP
jgi:hypothetical protein